MKKWTKHELERLRDEKRTGVSHATIAKELGRTKTAVDRQVDRMDKVGGVVVKHDVELPAPRFGRLPLSVINSGDWLNFGLVSDTHLCCQEQRLDALQCQYDLFASEGITTVFHGGNIVDGYIPKINGASALETSIDGQCQYVIDNYPSRKGITTHFITGNDHEGWWQKEGFNFGAYLMFLAGNQGRTDLNYIGHVESDVEIHTGAKKNPIIRIAHPGGGCPYARSYVAQKVTESYEGGEKPSVLILGHHHVSNYLNERNIHVINLPGFQSQTIFGRTKRLRYEIGGAILQFKVNQADGAITRCRVEFNLFFDRTYYKKFLKSDAKVVKGHLIITP